MIKGLAYSFFLALGMTLISPLPGLAQFSGADVVLSVIPELPAPEENVTVSISSFSAPLSSAKIAWYIDGKLRESGIDKKSFSFTSPESGKTASLSVIITLSDGATIEKSASITPRELDILWEAIDSYTPPFYKGKALPAPEALIRVVAMPSTGSGSELLYTWRRNFKNIPDVSGYGKQAFTFQNTYNHTNENIEVTAQSVSGTYAANRKTALTTVSPKIVFYENNTDTGISYHGAFSGGFSVSSDTLTLSAEPYFFSPDSASSDESSYLWLVDDIETRPPGRKNMITVANTGGETPITVTIDSIARLFQSATGSITIRFR